MEHTSKPTLRYAPSPTGPQHIGGIRTAFYCYLMAKKLGGEFILRIEDTDQTRYVEGAEQFIIDSCKWAGIDFTQGVHLGGPHTPYRQSERKEMYREYAERLVENGSAYYAFDTPEEIDAMKEKLKASGAKSPQYNYVTRGSMQNSIALPHDEVKRRLEAGEPYVIRMQIPRKEEVRFHDEVRGWVVIHSSHIDDKVLLKSDGMPTYHLANVVDDHLMGVTHVIRGEEWLPSTPLHVLLYRAFGWEDTMPVFAHLALLVNPDSSKMSKRNADKFGIPVFPMNWLDKASGDTWEGYKDLGYLPEAFMNYLALLGWHPGDEEEIMSIDEMIEKFSLDRVSKSPAKFDMDKLKHFNQVYLRAKPLEELMPMVKAEIEAAGYAVPDEDYLGKMIGMMRERVTFVREFVSFGTYFFEDPTEYDEKQLAKRWKGNVPDLMQRYLDTLGDKENWDSASLEADFDAFLAETETGKGKLLMPLRLVITGMPFGPSTFEIMELIGKDASLRRMSYALGNIAVGESQN